MLRKRAGYPRAIRKSPGDKALKMEDAYGKTLAAKTAALLFVLLFSLIPALYVGGDYGYIPLLAVVFTLALSFCYALLLKRFVSFSALSAYSRCLRGTEMDFQVELRNRSFLVFPRMEAIFYVSDLFGEVDSVTRASLTLTPFETRAFQFTVYFAHIGVYSASLKQIYIYDLLNLFRFTIPNEQVSKIEVSPRVQLLSDLEVNDTALFENLQSRIVTPLMGMDYSNVREYVYGDPIKRIHWKLSAHSRTYMTKILESYGASGITVIMDLVSPAYDAETMMCIFDAVVESALSICFFAHNSGMDYDLVYYDKNGDRKRRIPLAFYDAMDLVAELPGITANGQNYNANALLIEERNALYAKSNLALCTANLTEDIVNALLLTKKSGRNTILFYVIPAQIYDREKALLLRPLKRLEAAKITYYVFSSAENLIRTG